jgi:hypothetical protein
MHRPQFWSRWKCYFTKGIVWGDSGWSQITCSPIRQTRPGLGTFPEFPASTVDSYNPLCFCNFSNLVFPCLCLSHMWLKICRFCWSFQRNDFWSLWLFSISFTSTLIFTIFFVWLVLSLVRFYFSSSLQCRVWLLIWDRSFSLI